MVFRFADDALERFVRVLPTYLHVPGSLVLLVKDGRTKSCLDPAPILLLSIQQLDASRRPRVLCPAMEVSFVWT